MGDIRLISLISVMQRSVLIADLLVLTTVSMAVNPAQNGPCDKRKSEKLCDDQSKCVWDFQSKACVALHCHDYDHDLPKCDAASHCVHGQSEGKDVCFNDDCHFYGGPVEKKEKHHFFAGPEDKREQYCKDAKHCRHTETKDPRSGTSWSCAWEECDWYNRQLTAKQQCEETSHCAWEASTKKCKA